MAAGLSLTAVVNAQAADPEPSADSRDLRPASTPADPLAPLRIRSARKRWIQSTQELPPLVSPDSKPDLPPPPEKLVLPPEEAPPLEAVRVAERLPQVPAPAPAAEPEAPEPAAPQSPTADAPQPGAPETSPYDPPGAAQVQASWKPLDIRSITPHPDYRPELDNLPPGDPNLVPKSYKLDASLGGELDRTFADSVFVWEASNMYHNPLYFEDPQLERYGHAHHPLLQPFVSTGRFGLQLVGLPYQMAIDPVHKCMYTLGWYRPGECAPRRYYQIPLNEDAIAAEALFLFGAFHIFP